MVNPQLFDYIRQQSATGASKEEISKSLLANGWQVADINEAFTGFANHGPVPPFPNVQAPMQSPEHPSNIGIMPDSQYIGATAPSQTISPSPIQPSLPVYIQIVSAVLKVVSIIYIVAGVGTALVRFLIPDGWPFADNGTNVVWGLVGAATAIFGVLGVRVANSMRRLERGSAWTTIALIFVFAISPLAHFLASDTFGYASPWAFIQNSLNSQYVDIISLGHQTLWLLAGALVFSVIAYGSHRYLTVQKISTLDLATRSMAPLYIIWVLSTAWVWFIYPIMFPTAVFVNYGYTPCTSDSQCANAVDPGVGSSSTTCKLLDGDYSRTAGLVCRGQGQAW